MSLRSRLTALCTISRETHTRSNLGQSIRGFTDAVQVRCKLDPVGKGVREDMQLGKIIEDNRFVLFLGPDAVISKQHKVTQNGIDYKVDRVRPYENGRGALHHYECDLQEIQ